MCMCVCVCACVWVCVWGGVSACVSPPERFPFSGPWLSTAGSPFCPHISHLAPTSQAAWCEEKTTPDQYPSPWAWLEYWSSPLVILTRDEHIRDNSEDFPVGPLAKTPHSQCQGSSSIPSQRTRSHRLQPSPYHSEEACMPPVKTQHRQNK